MVEDKLNSRWISTKLLDIDRDLSESLNSYLGFDILSDSEIKLKLNEVQDILLENEIGKEVIRDRIVSKIVKKASIFIKTAFT